MKSNLNYDKYWIAGGIIIIILMFFIFPSSPYSSVDFRLTRSEAIKIAKDYLSDKDIDFSSYSVEGFVAEQSTVNKYLSKTLGNEEYSKLLNDPDWNLFGWTIFFHQNISGDIPQTTYTIHVSNSGRISAYEREIPDSLSSPSLDKQSALDLMTETINNNFPIDLSEYELKESREENYSNRTDHDFIWKRTNEIVPGEMVVRGKIQGNQAGQYSVSFLVPESDRGMFDTGEAVFGTVSVIFVAFLMVFALYYFLKKYHQGEIWINVGRSLFVIYFLVTLLVIINEWPNIGLGVQIGSLNFFAVKFIVVVLNGLLVQFLLALMVFATWSVSESYAREFWSEKLNGTDSIIKRHIFTLSAGTSLLRGLIIGLGISLLYLIASISLNEPGSKIFFSPVASFDVFYGFMPFISIVGEAFIEATLGGIVVTFFIASLTFSKWRKKWLSILFVGVSTIAFTVVASTPPSVNNFLTNLLFGFLFGILIAYLFFKFDLLTILAALFYSALTFDFFTLFSSSAKFFEINSYLVFILFAAVPAIYIISRIKKEKFVLEDYGLPSHIEKISERERLKKEMEIAAKVQLSLLPKEQPAIEGYDIASLSIPAKEAGGDYYDYVKLSDGRLGIAIGDVSGKGVGAAIYMTLTKGILQAHAEENVSPKVVLGKVNRLLYKTIEKNSFVSMFYAILDVRNHSLLYSRAGHNPGIFCSFEKQDSKLLMSKGIALGLEEGKVFQETLNEDTIQLKNGDVVVFYTDGFTEAMNHKIELYGEKRLIDLIQQNREKQANEILNLILKDVHKFTKDYPQHDDMTLVILKRN